MNPEFGLFAGLLAWVLGIAAAGIAALALAVPRPAADLPPWADLLAPTVQVQAATVLAALASLVGAFLADDFSVRYVATMSSSALPPAWQFDAVFSGAPGLWLLASASLATAGAALSLRPVLPGARRRVAALGFSAAASAAALAASAWVQMPFERLVPAAADGQALALARRVAAGHELSPVADGIGQWLALPSWQAVLPILGVALLWTLGWTWWLRRTPSLPRWQAQPLG